VEGLAKEWDMVREGENFGTVVGDNGEEEGAAFGFGATILHRDEEDAIAFRVP
jgi:hypothetical protein